MKSKWRTCFIVEKPATAYRGAARLLRYSGLEWAGQSMIRNAADGRGEKVWKDRRDRSREIRICNATVLEFAWVHGILG